MMGFLIDLCVNKANGGPLDALWGVKVVIDEDVNVMGMSWVIGVLAGMIWELKTVAGDAIGGCGVGRGLA